jgi:cystathionine beta-lyase
MTRFDFDTPVDRRHTSCEKWDRYAGRDVLPMWVADMDFLSPPAVRSALYERIDHGIFGYTHPPQALVDCVVDHLQTRYRWQVDPAWLVWLPGLVSGLNIACRGVGSPGDEVMSATPVYPPFLTAPRHFQRTLKRLPMVEDRGQWSLDLDRMAAGMSPATRLFLLCNPHNPVGRMFSRSELERLAEICLENDVIICSDEIHCDLILDPDKRHIPTATLAREVEQRTITLMAPSKTFNIPGLGCAFAVIASARLRRRFTAAMAGIVPHVNALGYSAALAAYRDGWPWLDELLVYLRANRDLVLDRVNRMEGLSTTPVEATYLAWIDTRPTGIENPAGFFESAGVGLSDGRDFDGAGFVRLNFGCPRSRLVDALDRMERAMAGRTPIAENSQKRWTR